MHPIDLDYYKAATDFIKIIDRGSLDRLKAWKKQYRNLITNPDGSCNPIDPIGSFVHAGMVSRLSRPEIDNGAYLILEAFADENLNHAVKAWLVAKLGPITSPDTMRPYFKKGAPYEVDIEELAYSYDDFLLRFRMTLNDKTIHPEGIGFVLDTLAGWDAFDRFIRDHALKPYSIVVLEALIQHDNHREAMEKRVFNVSREQLESKAILRFAVKHDKVGLSDLGIMLCNVTGHEGSCHDLAEEAAKLAIKRAHAFKSEPPLRNIQATKLVLSQKGVSTPARQKALTILDAEIERLKNGVEQGNAPREDAGLGL